MDLIDISTHRVGRRQWQWAVISYEPDDQTSIRAAGVERSRARATASAAAACGEVTLPTSISDYDLVRYRAAIGYRWAVRVAMRAVTDTGYRWRTIRGWTLTASAATAAAADAYLEWFDANGTPVHP